MRPLFEELGLEYEPAARRRVDAAIREIVGTPDGAHCPEVWAALKALSSEERDRLGDRVASILRRDDAPAPGSGG